jgi:hypothetical protein
LLLEAFLDYLYSDPDPCPTLIYPVLCPLLSQLLQLVGKILYSKLLDLAFLWPPHFETPPMYELKSFLK